MFCTGLRGERGVHGLKMPVLDGGWHWEVGMWREDLGQEKV